MFAHHILSSAARLVTCAAIIISPYLNHVIAMPLDVGGGGGWGGICGNPSVSQIKSDKRYASISRNLLLQANSSGREIDQINAIEYKNGSLADVWGHRHRMQQINQANVDRLARDYIHVRLNIVHDKALEDEHKDKPNGLNGFIKDLVYTTQLIYEQPEMAQHLKFNFVVTSVKLLTSLQFKAYQTSNDLLSEFGDTPEVTSEQDRADLHILLMYRTMGTLRDPTQLLHPGSKILGLAHLATFCSATSGTGRTMVLSADSLGTGPVFAHELAHALGVWHDTDPGGAFESKCQDGKTIMLPSAGPENLRWSSCTVDRLKYQFTDPKNGVFNCIYNQKRIASARPLSAEFDLNPSTPIGATNRKLLPGQAIPIDEQCSRYVSKNSKSALTMLGYSGSRYLTCNSLICFLGRKFSLSIGPAPPGTACKNAGSKEIGHCFQASCQAGTS